MTDSPFFSKRTNARLRAGRWTLAAAVFGAAMALGAVHTTVLLAVVPVLAAATWLVWQGTDPMRPRLAATLLFWTAAGLMLFTLAQVAPMPIAWLRVLAPQTADVYDRVLLPLGAAGPSWATLSLDPVETRVEVVRGAAYLLCFVAAVRIANRREGSLFLEGTLLATGVAIAVAAWVHPALGANKVFGIYTPRTDPGVRHMAPLLNANTLSGYLNIALCIAFGHAVAKRPSIPRPITVALAAFLAATQFWVASRGGMIGMVTGLVLVFWMTRAPGPGERSILRAVVPAIFVLAGVAMGVLSSSEEAWLELADTDVSKLEVGLRALHLVPLFPVFGIGRGAFQTVFPMVRRDPGHIVYTHPENIVAQWVTEWGPAVAVAAAVAILIALRPRTALARSPRAAGAWGAIACVGVHNLVDFSSEYPGVILSLTVCAALAAGGTSGVDSRSVWERWAKMPGVLAWASLVVAALAVALGVSAVGGDVAADRRMLQKDALDPQVSNEAFHAEIRAAMLRHPAEPYLPFTGALRAARTREDSVVGWVERAPVYGPAHVLLARALVKRSPAQARLEYRLATEQAPELWFTQAEAQKLVQSYDDATEIIVHGRSRAQSLDSAVVGLAARLPATAARLDADLMQLDPSSVPVALRQAQAALADVRGGDAAPWCRDDQKRCLDKALLLAARLEKMTPTVSQGYALHAEALVAGGDVPGAMKELSDACTRVTDRIVCLQSLATLAAAAKSDPPLSETLEQVAHAGCVEVRECVNNLEWVAAMELGRGNPRRAYAMLQRAHERDPSDDALLATLARQASSVDLHAEALRAYEDLAHRHPEETQWPAAISAEREALVRGSAKP
jgi:tetratricopeptide (TPR) repeat protein